MTDKTTIIRELNDAFRKSPTRRDQFVTDSIASLPVMQQVEIARLVQDYDDFTPENDPHGATLVRSAMAASKSGGKSPIATRPSTWAATIRPIRREPGVS